MPRNVLAIPAKTSTLPSGSLSRALREHIATHFTESHPDAFAEDVRAIAKLREGVAHVDVHVSRVESMQRYHAQLVFLGTKFPVDVNVAFPWQVAFPPILPLFSISVSLGPSAGNDDEGVDAQTSGSSSQPAKPFTKTTAQGQVVALPDLRYERAAVLFSLASLYSSIGANEPRSEGESLKRAISAFQSAAGVLQYILTEYAPILSTLWSGQNARFVDADLQPPMLSALRDAMLAQAQECFWQKAVVDRLKDATIARLATRVSDLYANALDFAQTGGSLEARDDGAPRGCELPKEWINHMTIKRWHFAAAAQYRKSIDDLAANRYGDELGRLKLADSHARKALDATRSGTSESLHADLKSLQSIIQTSLVRANKDNDLIYLQPVTSATALTAVPPAAMVDAKIPPEVSNPIPLLRESPPPAFGRPLFQELVPYGVHVAISIFDDRKDTFVREEIERKREELDGLATSTLQSLDLPGSLQALEQPEGLPPMLVRKSEEIRSEGGLRRLQAISSDVQRMANVAFGAWKQASDLAKHLLANGDADIGDALSAHIRERNRAQSQAFAGQIDEYGQTLEQARKSDVLVQQKLADWEKIIEVLAKGEMALEEYVPGQKGAAATMGRTQSAAVRALRIELEALDDIMDNRTTIVEEAKTRVRKHDIRPEIMREAGILASGSSSVAGSQGPPLIIEAAHFEPLFEREMETYDKLRAELLASEQEQEARLESIAARNGDFVQARNVNATMLRRQEALQTLDMGHAKYREITANLLEGLKFYNELSRMLSDVSSSISQWARQCEAERKEYAARRRQEQLEQQKQPTVVAKPKPRRGTHSHHGSSESGSNPTARRTRATAPDHQEQQPPAWGAWQGGDIRFAD